MCHFMTRTYKILVLNKGEPNLKKSFDKWLLLFQKDMKKISKSSDPDSTFINNYCRSRTFPLHVLLVKLAADFSSQWNV